jgi:hypothetical protein
MPVDQKFKEAIFEKLLALQSAKVQALANEIGANRENLSSATKSSAGDKHETGRAMLQLEQEKLGRSYAEAEKLMQLLLRVPFEKSFSQVKVGSLFTTQKGLFLLAASFGIVKHENQEVFVLGAAAPMSQIILGKSVGEEVEFRGDRICISAVI